jgi:chitin synthase
MKRPDIRLAWREKLTIFILIFLMNALVIFYIVEFGRLLCPNFDKAWSPTEVSEHTGNNDWWVSVQGQVYDMSNFIHGDHSDISGVASNSASDLEELVGQDLTNYFPPPLTLACPTLVTQTSVELVYKNFTPVVPLAMHMSGAAESTQGTALDNAGWYTATFQPKMKNYHKGPLVWTPKEIAAQAADPDIERYAYMLIALLVTQTTSSIWAIWESGIYDLTDYINTVTINQGATSLYQFLSTDVSDVFKQQAGQDITKPLNTALAGLDSATAAANINCLKNMFYLGETDFRDTPRCLVQNYLLLVFTSILCASIVLKCMSLSFS